MSIASEITRLQGVKTDILTAIADKGVTVPAGSALDDCPQLIASISSGEPQVPDTYKELLWIRSDYKENGNDASYVDLGTGYNTYTYKFELVDLTDCVKYMIDNNYTRDLYMLGMSNGDIKNVVLTQRSGSIEAKFVQAGTSGLSPTVLTDVPSVCQCFTYKDYAVLNGVTLNRGSGTVRVGTGSITPVLGRGSDPASLVKLGRIKVYTESDELFQDWRPVEKIDGSNNRFGYYDIVNNVFKASERLGRYLVPGPYLLD